MIHRGGFFRGGSGCTLASQSSLEAAGSDRGSSMRRTRIKGDDAALENRVEGSGSVGTPLPEEAS